MTQTLTDVTIEKDLAYGPDPSQRLDLYHPAGPPKAALLDIHGGGWWQGDKSKEIVLAMALAQAGYLVGAVNYRLATNNMNPYPTQVDDCSLALEWLWQAQPGVPRRLFGAVGASSGGNLAVEMAIRHGLPAASWSGLLDLEGFVQDHPTVVPHLPTFDQSAASAGIDQGGPDPGYYVWLVRNLLAGDMTKAGQASPLNRIGATTGPLFLANSLAELVPATEAIKVANAATVHGVPSRTLLLEGSRHGQGYMNCALPGTLEFMAHYLGTETG